MPPEWLLLPALFAAALQTFLRFGLGPRRPIGDEIEYLQRASSPDPFGPTPFLRVPAMPLLARLLGPGNTEPRFRNALALLSLLTAGLVAATGFTVWGPAGACVSMLLYLILPDRMVLSLQIWPDTLLAFWHSALALALVLSNSASPPPPLLVGGLLAAIVLTRIEGLILLPALILLASFLPGAFLPAALAYAWPTLAALLLLSALNARRYGIAMPDTTFLFNVSVLAAEEIHPRPETRSVEKTTVSTWLKWASQSHPEHIRVARSDFRRLLRDPLKALKGIATRCWQMLGPDTFGCQILFHPHKGVFPGIHPALRALLLRGLRFCFPLLSALALAGGLVSPPARILLVPALAAFGVACLFQARTRFRYPVLPALSLAGTPAILALFHTETRWIVLPVFLLASLVLIRSPGRKETD